jgi:hypothetical protein
MATTLPPALSKAFDEAVASVRALAAALDGAGISGLASNMRMLVNDLDGPQRRWAAGCVTQKSPGKLTKPQRAACAAEKAAAAVRVKAALDKGEDDMVPGALDAEGK